MGNDGDRKADRGYLYLSLFKQSQSAATVIVLKQQDDRRRQREGEEEGGCKLWEESEERDQTAGGRLGATEEKKKGRKELKWSERGQLIGTHSHSCCKCLWVMCS